MRFFSAVSPQTRLARGDCHGACAEDGLNLCGSTDQSSGNQWGQGPANARASWPRSPTGKNIPAPDKQHPPRRGGSPTRPAPAPVHWPSLQPSKKRKPTFPMHPDKEKALTKDDHADRLSLGLSQFLRPGEDPVRLGPSLSTNLYGLPPSHVKANRRSSRSTLRVDVQVDRLKPPHELSQLQFPAIPRGACHLYLGWPNVPGSRARGYAGKVRFTQGL